MRHLLVHLHHHHIHILGILLIGLVIGTVARVFIPGNNPGGCIFTTLLGVAGAIFGTMFCLLLGFGHRVSILAAIFGAICLLLVYRVVIDKR